MTEFILGRRSASRLNGVHPLLQAVVVLALKKYAVRDFGVARDCVRTQKRQAELVNAGRSKTMNSLHRIQSDGFSHAVDLYPSGYASVADMEWQAFVDVADAMRAAAHELGVGIRWGADWDGDGLTRRDGDKDETFVDAPHFELLK